MGYAVVNPFTAARLNYNGSWCNLKLLIGSLSNYVICLRYLNGAFPVKVELYGDNVFYRSVSVFTVICVGDRAYAIYL